MHLRVEGDEPLRVVVRPIADGPRGVRGGEVAEGLEPLARLRVLLPTLHAAVLGTQADQQRPHLVPLPRPARREVALLPRVVQEVVELGDRQVDVLQAAPHDAVERSPAPVHHPGERLEIHGRARLLAPHRCRQEAPSREAVRNPQAEGVDHGGQEVDVPHRFRHPPRAQQARAVQEERHVEGRVIGEDPVRLLAVLAPRLAVVAGQDHQGAALRAPGEERTEQRLEGLVGRGHLARVGIRGEARREGPGGPVREVRLVEVDPEERRGSPRAGEPLPRGRHRPCARALLLPPAQPVISAQEAVVVDVEARGEPELRGEGERADEGPRPVAARLEEGGQRVDPPRKAEPGVVAHAVLQRIAPGQDVRVGGKGDDVVGVGALEPHALAGQAVHPGRGRDRVAARPEGVGPQGVDRDENDVEAGLALHPPRAGRQGSRQQGEQCCRPLHRPPLLTFIDPPPYPSPRRGRGMLFRDRLRSSLLQAIIVMVSA